MERDTLPSKGRYSFSNTPMGGRLIAAVVALAVLAGLAPLLQGCGEDLVIGGGLVVPTVAPTSTGPTATPDPDDEN